MGLFFNFEKAGPGIDKDAPKKKGIFLYTELFSRKLLPLIKANMLYFTASLPVMAVYNLIIINVLSAALPQEMKGSAWQLSLVLTAVITILWGTGPVSCGYSYILRNFAREEHAWIFSDLFEKARETFKLGMAVLICDILFLILDIYAVGIYIGMIRQGIASAQVAFIANLVIIAVYTFMHYYIYQLGVTFEGSVCRTIKNAFVMGFAMLPANLFLTFFVIAMTVFVLGILPPPAIILLMFVLWISFMRFPIDFYVARMIKRKFIDNSENGEDKE